MPNFLLALISLLHVALALAWQWIDRAYPRNDIAQYWSITAKIADELHSTGFWGLPKSLYTIRSHKPILHSMTAFPFFMLGGEDVLRARILTTVFFYGLFCVYVTLGGKRLFKGIPLTLWCVFLPGLTWVFLNTHDLTTEICYLAYGAGFFYHLLASERLSIRKHAALAGLFLFLGLSNRPESVALFAPACLGYFIHCKRNGTMAKNTLSITLGLVVLAIARPIYVIYVNRHATVDSMPDADYSFGFALSMLVFAMAVKTVWMKRTNLAVSAVPLLFVCGAVGATLLWYGPYLNWMYTWANYSSFGEMLTQGSRRSFTNPHRVTNLQFLSLLFRNYWGTFGLMLLALIPLGRPWKALKTLRSRYKIERTDWFFIFATLGALPIMGSLSFSDDQRYFILNMVLLYALAAAAVLRASGVLKLPAFAGLIALCSIQTFVNYQTGFGSMTLQEPTLNRFLNLPEPQLVPITPVKIKDPIAQLLEGANAVLEKQPFFKKGSELRIYARHNIQPYAARIFFDYTLLDGSTLALLQRNFSFKISVDDSDGFNEKKLGGDYCLVGPLESGLNYSTPINQSVFHQTIEKMKTNGFASDRYRFLSLIKISHPNRYEMTFAILKAL